MWTYTRPVHGCWGTRGYTWRLRRGSIRGRWDRDTTGATTDVGSQDYPPPRSRGRDGEGSENWNPLTEESGATRSQRSELLPRLATERVSSHTPPPSLDFEGFEDRDTDRVSFVNEVYTVVERTDTDTWHGAAGSVSRTTPGTLSSDLGTQSKMVHRTPSRRKVGVPVPTPLDGEGVETGKDGRRWEKVKVHPYTHSTALEHPVHTLTDLDSPWTHTSTHGSDTHTYMCAYLHETPRVHKCTQGPDTPQSPTVGLGRGGRGRWGSRLGTRSRRVRCGTWV